jgi:hypothetical protein
MPRYSYAQIKDLWVLHGGDPKTASVAAAIAMAESGGNSDAVSKPNSNGTLDRGLFQVNSIHGGHSTTDLAGNIKFAIQLSKNGTNWKPWSVWWKVPFKEGPGEGVWKQHFDGQGTLPGTVEIDIPEPSSGPSLSNPLDVLTKLVAPIEMLSKGGAWISDSRNMVRVVQVVIGGVMIIAGLVMLNMSLALKVAEPVAKAVVGSKGIPIP